MKTVARKLNGESLDSFSFQTDEQPADFVVDWFCNWLENYITGGAEIQDGQTLQIGYTLVKCNVDSKTLRLESPTFQSIPIEWSANMGPAFQILGWHKYIPESVSYTHLTLPTICSV